METKLKHFVLTVFFAVLTLTTMAQAPANAKERRAALLTPEYYTNWIGASFFTIAGIEKDLEVTPVQIHNLTFFYDFGTCFVGMEANEKGQNFESVLISIIEWINTTYNINLRFNAPTEIGSVLGKIRHLFAEMDSLIKQYQLYVEDGCIDYELLSTSSSPLGLNQIKSALYPRPKYVSIGKDSSEIKWFQELLSSDNSTFSKKSLFTQIKHGNRIELEYSSQRAYINRMIEKGIINISLEGKYVITPVGNLLNILYHKEFVMIDRLPLEILQILPMQETSGWLEYSSSLLHIKEAQYFNFWLNKKDFTNGCDLRNRYMHGVQPTEKEKIENDYQIVKLLFILLLLKIIDDIEL